MASVRRFLRPDTLAFVEGMKPAVRARVEAGYPRGLNAFHWYIVSGLPDATATAMLSYENEHTKSVWAERGIEREMTALVEMRKARTVKSGQDPAKTCLEHVEESAEPDAEVISKLRRLCMEWYHEVPTLKDLDVAYSFYLHHGGADAKTSLADNEWVHVLGCSS
jgi:hypothetical protein